MGYYSDVGICVKKENFDELKERVNALKDNTVTSFIESAKYVDYGSEEVILTWDYIKWYPEFAEVQFITSFLSELKTRGIAYSFIRVGEENGDIEIDNYYGADDNDFSCSHLGTNTIITIE